MSPKRKGLAKPKTTPKDFKRITPFFEIISQPIEIFSSGCLKRHFILTYILIEAIKIPTKIIIRRIH